MKKLIVYIILTCGIVFGWLYFTNTQSKNFNKNLKPYDLKAFKVIGPIFRFGDKTFACTGFVISDYIALTAAHCLVDSFRLMKTTPLSVYDDTGADLKMQIKAVKVVMDRDLGVLTGDFRSFDRLIVDWSGVYFPQFGQGLVSCGFPNGGDYLKCFNHTTTETAFNSIYTHGILIKGMSGGPVSSYGFVVGINSKTDGVSTAIMVPIVNTKGILGLLDE